MVETCIMYFAHILLLLALNHRLRQLFLRKFAQRRFCKINVSIFWWIVFFQIKLKRTCLSWTQKWSWRPYEDTVTHWQVVWHLMYERTVHFIGQLHAKQTFWQSIAWWEISLFAYSAWKGPNFILSFSCQLFNFCREKWTQSCSWIWFGNFVRFTIHSNALVVCVLLGLLTGCVPDR